MAAATSGPTGPASSVLVEEGKIQWVGEESSHSLPKKVSIVDAGGRYAIPGLLDMHAHSYGSDGASFLAYGVTSVRDTGGGLAGLSSQTDRSEFTTLAVPRCFFSGEVLEGERPYWGDGFMTVDNEPEACAFVGRSKDLGASLIKIYDSLSWPMRRAIAAETRRVGIPAIGHGMWVEDIVKSTTQGFFSIEHAAAPVANFDDVNQMLALSGTRWDPTLIVTGGASLLLRDEPERLADNKFVRTIPVAYLDFAKTADYEKMASNDALRGSLRGQLEAVKRARARGVTMLVGTDAPNPGCFYGLSLHWEMARFVEAGFSPLEVIQLATEGGAAAVGADDLGAITPGKLADIVLLDANPLEAIRNTETIWRVIKGGVVFDPEALQQK